MTTARYPLAILLQQHGLNQSLFGQAMGYARSTISHWLKHGREPSRIDPDQVTAWLIEQGVPAEAAAGWRPLPENAGADTPVETSHPQETESMLLRRQVIHQATQRHFGLTHDPFMRDLESHEDVFESQDVRYVRESMWSTARHGGLLAVVGESGSGKSTLLDDIEDRIRRTGEPLVLIRPDVTGMEANDKRGKTLRVAHIQEAVLSAVAPLDRPRQSPQARAEQMRKALIASRDGGNRHCLAIDEAHCMPVATLKHLKRLLEVKHGFTRLLSIILLGQPELGLRLSEQNPEVREVVQRCEVVTLEPLGPSMEPYLEFKLGRAQAGIKGVRAVIDEGGLQAMRERLQMSAQRVSHGRPRSLAYPLAVGNLFAAALNIAAEAGAPIVTAEAVMEVGR